jgi:hypothetical protein
MKRETSKKGTLGFGTMTSARGKSILEIGKNT